MSTRRKNTKKKKLQTIVAVEAAVLAVLIGVLIFAMATKKPGKQTASQPDTTPATTPQPSQTDINTTTIPLSQKSPEEYTWDEYCSLPADEQVLFPDRFPSMEAFNAWYDRVSPAGPSQTTPQTTPGAQQTAPAGPVIDLQGKRPEELTWKEYESLTPEQQAIFPDLFESMDAFYAWMDKAQPSQTTPPTTTTSAPPTTTPAVTTPGAGGKAPQDYTWEEYTALPIEEQATFPDLFESMDAFYAWMDKAQKEAQDPGFDTDIDLNGKKPEDFTWDDYMALTIEQQMLFPDLFESMDAFNAWYQRVEPKN